MVGTLYLIPVSLSPSDQACIHQVLPDAVLRQTAQLAHFIVEHPKTARQFLKQIACQKPLQQIEMQVLNEHTPPNALLSLLEPLLSGHDVGLLSEAGCPAVADPGAGLIRLAHQKNIPVVPMVGPSSILLALMASGLNGQRFAFNGYLPIEVEARTKKIVQLEKLSINNDQTQIFIETPYRNQKLLEQLISVCQGQTDLCVASNLTTANEMIQTQSINAWKTTPLNIHKIPAIFLLHG